MAAKVRVRKRKVRLARKQQQQVVATPSRMITQTTRKLDQAAIDHINLMSDPCNGKLVYGAYPHAGGGVLQRVRAVLPLAGGAGETCGVLHWIPSINFVFLNGAASPTTSFTPTSSNPFPAYSYSDGDASQFGLRCVAACVRIITNSSEMNRAGIVYCGNTEANYLNYTTGALTTPSAVASSLPITTRIPSGSMETLWVPMIGDQNFNTTKSGAGLYTGSNDSFGAITYSIVGLPANTGVSVELTAVYEVESKANGTINTLQKPPSSSSWQDVLRGFYDKNGGRTTFLDLFNKGAEYVGTAGAAALGQVVKGAAMALL